jgi:hypothetical protein
MAGRGERWSHVLLPGQEKEAARRAQCNRMLARQQWDQPVDGTACIRNRRVAQTAQRLRQCSQHVRVALCGEASQQGWTCGRAIATMNCLCQRVRGFRAHPWLGVSQYGRDGVHQICALQPAQCTYGQPPQFGHGRAQIFNQQLKLARCLGTRIFCCNQLLPLPGVLAEQGAWILLA